MALYVLLIDKNDLDNVKTTFKDALVAVDNQYLAFKALDNQTSIEAYQSGKIVFKGDDPLATIKKIDVNYQITTSPTMEKEINTDSAIGSDEVGTGDLFGPIVVCSFYVDKSQMASLDSLGIKDSKKLTDEQIISLASKLQNYPYTVVILDNPKYNDLISRGYNMNSLKAVMHNKAIIDMQDKLQRKTPVVLDQFCEKNLYFHYLDGCKRIWSQIIFKTKAESYHLAVACASIMARFFFLKKMHELSLELGQTLLKGAGEKVDEQLKSLIDQNIDLNKYVKMNFKNLKKYRSQK